MTDKERKLRQIIDDFENRKLDGQNAVNQIKELTGEAIDIGYLSEYWAAESLDMFVNKILIEHIVDWQEIDDNRAIDLIEEIMANGANDTIVLRNSMALERRYAKPEGTVIEKIFNDDIQDSRIILMELKRDTIILL